MLRLLLNAHSRIAIPGETSFFVALSEAPPYPNAPWHSLVAMALSCFETALVPPIDGTRIERELLARPGDPRLLCELPLSRWAASEGKPRWGEKTPGHIFYLDTVMQLFPDAKVIAIKRDPRAVVASMNSYVQAGNDTALNAHLWRDVWTKGRRLLDSAVPSANRLLVDYDELVAHPEPSVRSICAFIDESYEPGMLDFGEASSRYVATIRTPKLTQSITPPEATFQDRLSARDIAIIEMVCGPVMNDLGYTPSGVRPSLRARSNTRAKLLYVKAKQLQHRQARYHSVTYAPFGRLRRLASRVPSHRGRP